MKKIQLFVLTSMLACSSCANYTEASAEKENTFEAGTKFNIILPENHQDGATWQLTDDHDKDVVKTVNAVWHGPDKGLYYTMQAGRAGQTTVHFFKRMHRDTLEHKNYVIRVINP